LDFWLLFFYADSLHPTSKEEESVVTKREAKSWGQELQTVFKRVESRFPRKELKGHALNYAQGLISRVERKNGWQLAEELGEKTPTNLQHFISRSRWNANQVRDDLRNYGSEHLGSEEGILILDETGFLKKGDKSVGVKRQYSGTAGRIENCQIGVFLAYRSGKGHAFLDRRLYLPKEWCSDSDRRTEARVPEEIRFATKPTLAREMIQQTLDAGVPCRWVTADSVYGGDSKFRCLLEQKSLSYVVAVTSQQRLWSPELVQLRVDEYTAELAEDWQELSCGTGTKGERIYRWCLMKFGQPQTNDQEQTFQKALLVRESLKDPGERSYYFTHAEAETPLSRLVEIAGSRWCVEECFQQAKGEAGLDEYEVRSWVGWHRHITLSMLAHAALVVMRNRANQARSKKRKSRN